MNTAQLVEEFNKLRTELTAKGATLKSEEEAFNRAAVAALDARAKLEALKDPLLRTAEEQAQTERQRLLAELRKLAGLDSTASSMGTSTPSERQRALERIRQRSGSAGALSQSSSLLRRMALKLPST